MKNNSKMFCKVQQQSFLTVTNDRCTNNNIMDLNFTLLTSFPRRLKLENLQKTGSISGRCSSNESSLFHKTGLEKAAEIEPIISVNQLFFSLKLTFKREKSVFWKASFLQNKNFIQLRLQNFVYNTSRLVRIYPLSSVP